MKIKIITQILCICLFFLNLFGIITILQNYDKIYSEAFVILAISIFSLSLILSLIVFLFTFSNLSKKIPSFLMFMVVGMHLFLLFYDLLASRSFPEPITFNVPEIKIHSLMIIIIAVNTTFFFWFAGSLQDNKNSYLIKLKEIYANVNLWLGSIFTYVPILAGILTPMFIYFPIAYFSWKVFSFICQTKIGYYDYYNSWFVINPDDTSLILTLIVIETTIFIFGLFIFLWGLIHLAKARKANINIVQTGPYKFIRHPQNLGILIMSFPFVLYIPEFIYDVLNLPFYYDIGIRIADFLSWILFSLIIIVICDFEERMMIKKFPFEYNNYRNETGFFFPKILKKKLIRIENKRIYYAFRYFLLIFCFILIVLITNFIAKILYTDGIVIIYR